MVSSSNDALVTGGPPARETAALVMAGSDETAIFVSAG